MAEGDRISGAFGAFIQLLLASFLLDLDGDWRPASALFGLLLAFFLLDFFALRAVAVDPRPNVSHKNFVKHEETARKSPKEAQAASKTQVKHNFL